VDLTSPSGFVARDSNDRHISFTGPLCGFCIYGQLPKGSLQTEYRRTAVLMTHHGLEQFTHLDAIGIMATARHELREDKATTKAELAEATRLLKKAAAFQLSLTQPGFDFNY
jgi:hypothetical protein